MPIQVYLDSSDYSVLSDPKTKDAQVKQAKAKLVGFLNRGDIEIRYSCIHVLEMAHTSIEHRELALKRFDILEELCRKKTLYFISNMENAEIALLAKGEKNDLDVQIIANDDDRWIPDITSNIKDFKKSLFDQLFVELKKQGISRNQRIGLQKKLFKRGRLTDVGYKFFSKNPKNRESLNYALSLEMPLTEKLWKEDLYLQFLRGHVTESMIRKEFEKGFLDPVNFIGWHINRHKEGLEMPKHFRGMSAIQTNKLKELQKQCQEFYALGIRAQMPEQEIQQNLKKFRIRLNKNIEDFRRSRLEKIWNSRQQDLLKLGVTKKRWNSNVKLSKLGQTPSIDFQFQSLITYMMNSVSNPKNSRTLLKSDFPDLMHGRYLPYFDIFRADRFIGSLLSPVAKGYNTRIVTSFIELPTIIDQMLSNK